MTDEEALHLHDRAALGEPLTDEESARLEAWYAAQDAAEARELAAASTDSRDLTQRIQASLEQIAETTRQIQQTLTDNDSLRREIASLPSLPRFASWFENAPAIAVSTVGSTRWTPGAS